MNHPATHILVFDSGVGGLSIVHHIRQQLPTTTITYLADNLFFPYGLLEEQTLIDRVAALLSQAAQQHQPDAIVIACNSASTLALPPLRKILDIPIVGVVPAIKPAAQQSRSKVIGLLATPGTIQRDYTDDLITEFATRCDIIRIGSSDLVSIVEKKLSGANYAPEVFAEIMQPMRRHSRWLEMDTMVLACTHFPLVKEELSRAAPEITHWVDSGDAIARRVKYVLSELTQNNTMHQHSLTDGLNQGVQAAKSNTALFTNAENLNTPLKNTLLNMGFDTITQWG